MSQTSNNTLPESLNTEFLTEDEYHALLAVEERRLALDALANQTGSTSLRELAAEVVERKQGSKLDADSVEQMAILLHHAHLPKMVNLDIIHYDVETHLIEQTERHSLS